MAFELNSNIPMAYQFGPGPLEQVSKLMSIADMLDKRKMNQLQLEQAKSKIAAQKGMKEIFQSDLDRYNTPTPMRRMDTSTPSVTEPSMALDMGETAVSPPVEMPQPEPQAPAGLNFPLNYGPDIQPEYPTAKYEGTVGRNELARRMPVNIPQQEAIQPQAIQPQAIQPTAPIEAPQVPQMAPQEAVSRIPKGYQWMQPDEYEHFVKARVVDPEYAHEYAKDLVEQRYKLALTEKASREQEEKDKTAADQRRLEMEIKKHGLISNIFTGAKDKKTGEYDPASVNTALVRARALGFDESRLPENPTRDQIDDWIAEDRALKKDSASKDPYLEQKARFNQEKDLRDSFQNQAKPYITMRDQYARMMSLNTANPAGQIGLVYSIMKLYDPGSVVRESEYATAQNAAGVPTVVRNMWNKVLSGEFLADKQIKDFKEQATHLYSSAEDSFGNLKNQYSKVSMDYGIKPTNVTGGLDLAKYKVVEVK